MFNQVGVSLLLETLGTCFHLSYGWKTASNIGVVHWEPPYSIIVRLPVIIISQGYFFYRAWALSGKQLIFLCFWVITAAAELFSGEATFFVFVFKRTAAQTKPSETIDLLTTHLILMAALDLVTSTCFILRLRSMKSSIKRSDRVVRQILLLTIVSNLTFFTLAFTTLLFWLFILSAKWYHIPLELSYRSYAIAFLCALLTRDSMREQLQSPIRTLQFPIDLNEDPPCQQDPETQEISNLEFGRSMPLVFTSPVTRSRSLSDSTAVEDRFNSNLKGPCLSEPVIARTRPSPSLAIIERDNSLG